MEVEYVYALHDFEPQNDDEIAFVAGERIEVLEKDEAYGDGWWTVSADANEQVDPISHLLGPQSRRPRRHLSKGLYHSCRSTHP